METRKLSFRCPEEVAALLLAASHEQSRSLSHQLVHYVREGLLRDGLPRILWPDTREPK